MGITSKIMYRQNAELAGIGCCISQPKITCTRLEPDFCPTQGSTILYHSCAFTILPSTLSSTVFIDLAQLASRLLLKYEPPPIHDMPRAEVGTSKYVANKMRSKGLQRLRWYCQVCEKQCRDENGFKCHTQSESHVRNIMAVSSNPNKKIEEFSRDFKNDFLKQLRTSHGTKSVHINHFYQNYIAHKEHIHMNATKWPSLTEFAKYLGREGICRVEENEKGLHVAWIDNSPEALRRQDAVRRQDAMEKGDEEREQRMIDEQIKRAQKATTEDEEIDDEAKQLQRAEGEKITLNFGSKAAVTKPPTTLAGDTASNATVSTPAPAFTMSFSTASNNPKNVFAAAKKNPLAAKKGSTFKQPEKMSEAERIMKEEIERKRLAESRGIGGGGKRLKIS
jgi:DNA/RNA-binding protein KIN17